jgi:hypothetical protein
LNTTKSSSTAVSLGILGWLLLLCFGPYFPVFGVPLRLDHFLFPTVGMLVWIGCCLKAHRCRVPPVLAAYLGFLAAAAAGTCIALPKEEFYILPVPFFAALDNHLRIVLIVLLAAALSVRNRIDVRRIVKGVLIASGVLAVFGYFQVSEVPTRAHEFTEWLTKAAYCGRHREGAKAIPELLLRIRAVSTFYLPGNFSLFCSLALVFLTVAKDRLGFSNIVRLPLLFLVVTGLFFSASKGFFVGLGVLALYLFFRKKWARLLEISVMLLVASVISSTFAPSPARFYKSYLMPDNYYVWYNQVVGTRFGEFVRKKNRKSADEEKEQGKARDHFDRADESGAENDGKLPVEIERQRRKTPKGEEEGKKNESTGYRFSFEKGNLSKALKTVSANPVFGTGYVSNVDYGDSMLVHVLVRGGALGLVLYIAFIFHMAAAVYRANRKNPETRPFAVAWILACAIFFIGGAAYPTFIQDRSGDVFWWLGALLLFTKGSDPVD